MEVFFHKKEYPTIGMVEATAEFKGAGLLGFITYDAHTQTAYFYPPEEANEGLIAEWWEDLKRWDRKNVPAWVRSARKKWLPILKKMV